MCRLLRFVTLLGLLLPATASAQSVQVRLAWDGSPDPDVAGYVIEYGTAPGTYVHSADVGARTEYAVAGLTRRQNYYFVVRAYDATGVLSSRSNEVVFTAPQPALPPSGIPNQLVWRHSTSGAVAQWELDGLYQVGGSSVGAGPVPVDWQIAGAGDFNGDGHRDIVWQHQDGWLSVWLMRGSSVLAGELLQPDRVPDTAWRIAAVSDMDLDGRADLVWQHQTNGQVAVWFMNGLRSRTAGLLSPGQVSDLDWKIIGAGDFNGDRSNDLLWRHRTSGDLAVWFMNGERQVRGAALSPGTVGTEWTVASVADLNYDGKADLVWQHDDGRLAAWIMDGVRLVSGTEFEPGVVADPRWKIVAVR